MTQQNSHPENDPQSNEEKKVSRRKVIKGAMYTAAAAGALSATVAQGQEDNNLLKAQTEGTDTTNKGYGYSDTIKQSIAEASSGREHFPYSQTNRNWITNVAYWFEYPSSDKEVLEVWGYTDKLSYSPGDEVALHVNTTAPTYEIEIFRDGGKWESVHKEEGITGAYHETPIKCFRTGCDWPVSHRFRIPRDWQTGGYVIVLRAHKEEESVEQEAFFVLKPSQLGKNSKILFVLSTPTWIAYSDFAGGSSYRIPPELGGGGMEARDTSYSTHCSIHRPWARGFIRQPVGTPSWAWKPRTYDDAPIGWQIRYPATEYYLANGLSFKNMLGGWASFDSHFARWAERSGYAIDYAEQHDILDNPNLLKNYNAVVCVGHDEYVTHEFRSALDAFVERGGGLARFAGNMNWQVRFEDGVQICYKHRYKEDPVYADPQTRHLVSTWWHQFDGANNPPVTTWGVNGHKGVYAMVGGATPRGAGGFTVYRNKHWAFEGADLYYGDILGGDVPVIGPEVDGIEYTFRYGLPYPTGEDGAPMNLEILALAPAIAGEEVDHGSPPEAHFIGDSRIDAVQYVETLGLEMTEENIDKFVRGCAAITYMRKGQGEVFTAGTLDWVRGLEKRDPFIDRITRNVLDRFSA